VLIAAGAAALTVIIALSTWLLFGSAPGDSGLRAGNSLSVFGTIHPKLISYGAPALQSDVPEGPRARFDLASFEDRFAVPQDSPPTRSLQASAQPAASFDDRFTSASFEDRFVGTVSARITTTRSLTAEANAAPRIAAPRVVAAAAPVAQAPAPAPRVATRSVVAQAAPSAPKKAASGGYQLASLSETPLPPAYASVDSGTKNSAMNDFILKKLTPRDPDPQQEAAVAPQDTPPKDAPSGPDTSKTAIYDITAHTVYMPDGRRLEAHSGLGEHMDDVRYINLKMRGPTPPNVYRLSLREAMFHGVRAIRLNPVDDGKMFGRDGILAHTYMLGPNGQSNGCVSFNDYQAFLSAFQRGEVTRLVVVEHLDDVPAGPRTASGGWLADKLRDIFGRS
jgi:hypothetical protein